MKIKGKTGIDYEIVIGIEVHTQLNTETKLFSSTPADWESIPNENVSMFDIATPGQMPILNWVAVEKAVKTGLALNAIINPVSIFDRKHYFYPDLPQGFQITQFYEPIVLNGFLTINTEDGGEKKIRINRAHLEQDAGKLMHDLIPGKSVVDLNRSGVPLLEIVSEPDIKSPFEATEYIKNLRAILRAVGTSSADMEKGEMRCDINISVMPCGSAVFGTRCEIKNVNSIRFAAKAIEYEAYRQVEEIEAGREVISETRLFDANLGITKSMRRKEVTADYRYMPEPDLKPVKITLEMIEKIQKEIPELPFEKQKRYVASCGISKEDALLLTSEVEFSNYYEEMLQFSSNSKLCASMLTSELFAFLNKNGIALSECKVNARNLASLVNFITDGTISGKQAKDVLPIMFEEGKTANEIIKEKGLMQISNPFEIEKIIEDVLAKNAEKVAEYKSGKIKLFGFFTGEVMKASGGKVNPALTNKILTEKLGN